MVWEWSHTEEAYDNLRTNIRNLGIETLKISWLEITTYKICQSIAEQYKVTLFGNFSLDIYKALENSEHLEELIENHVNSSEEFTVLSEIIFEFASKLRECTNGGHEAYITPYNTRTVSFS
jgi:hypothetical protein